MYVFPTVHTWIAGYVVSLVFTHGIISKMCELLVHTKPRIDFLQAWGSWEVLHRVLLKYPINSDRFQWV